VHEHPIQIYYEDTDHSGLVYHANYLKYFERAREHLLGAAELRRLLEEEGVGFVVYKVSLTFREGAVFADTITIRSAVEKESAYRLVFDQRAFRGETLLVEGRVEMVCVGPDKRLVPLPESVLAALRSSHPPPVEGA
jgi:tol-pal system-associated acyl-CoA thioesterase